MIFLLKRRNRVITYLPAWVILALSAAIVLSAFGVIYSQDVHRRLLVDKQSLEIDYHRLQVEKGKRLLEHGVLTSEARVERLARQLLNMHIPISSDITLVPLRLAP